MNFVNWTELLFKNAWRNLLRNPRRTLLSLVSISSATSAILIFASYEKSLIKTTRQNVITAYYAHYEITDKDYAEKKVDSPYGYQIEDVDSLRSSIEAEVGPLAFLSRRQDFFGLLNFNDRSFGALGLAIDAKEEQKFLTLAQVSAGKHLGDSPLESAFVGEGVAKALKLKIGDTLTLLVTTSQGSINAQDLTVTGMFKTGVMDLDDRAFYIHQELVNSLLKIKGSPRVLIGFSKSDELPLQKPLEDLLRRKFPNLKASHWLERAPFFNNLMGWISKQISVFYFIVLIVSTLSIVN
ncbi:MAG: hypothetical protein NTV34_11985, partial [Proteobacteria bacterium]|nr:hypothetical protein [Pseudomonadota bacterium]